jgi:DNA-binding CsgD family transcriptional regulator
MTTARYRTSPHQLAKNLATSLVNGPASDGSFSPPDRHVGADRRASARHPSSFGRPGLKTSRPSLALAGALGIHVENDRAGERAPDRDLLAELQHIPVPPESMLHRVFDLTPAEARLARKLARGDSLEQVAQSLDVKMTTARSQLAAIFAKTGTCRQAQLVAILSRLAHLA